MYPHIFTVDGYEITINGNVHFQRLYREMSNYNCWRRKWFVNKEKRRCRRVKRIGKWWRRLAKGRSRKRRKKFSEYFTLLYAMAKSSKYFRDFVNQTPNTFVINKSKNTFYWHILFIARNLFLQVVKKWKVNYLAKIFMRQLDTLLRYHTLSLYSNVYKDVYLWISTSIYVCVFACMYICNEIILQHGAAEVHPENDSLLSPCDYPAQ